MRGESKFVARAMFILFSLTGAILTYAIVSSRRRSAAMHDKGERVVSEPDKLSDEQQEDLIDL